MNKKIDQNKMATIVAAAIINNQQGQILICQRGAGGSCEYLWEFPGGKLEPDETLDQCVIRECKEELDVDIQVHSVFAKTIYAYPGRNISFTFFKAVITGGTLKTGVHNDIQWVSPQKLDKYEFCPADEEIIERLMKNG